MKRAEFAGRGRLTLDCSQLGRHLGQHQHVLQLYGHDKSLLRKNVGRYLSQALLRGDAAVVIASASHQHDFCNELARLEVDVSAAERQQRLFLFDASDMLDRIVVNDSPDAASFEQHVAEAVRQARVATRNGVVRAYGERAFFAAIPSMCSTSSLSSEWLERCWLRIRSFCRARRARSLRARCNKQWMTF